MIPLTACLARQQALYESMGLDHEAQIATEVKRHRFMVRCVFLGPDLHTMACLIQDLPGRASSAPHTECVVRLMEATFIPSPRICTLACCAFMGGSSLILILLQLGFSEAASTKVPLLRKTTHHLTQFVFVRRYSSPSTTWKKLRNGC